MKLIVDEDIVLEGSSIMYVSELFEIIQNNRDYLSVFLPWVDHMAKEADFRDYILNAIFKNQEHYEASFTIIYQGKAVGRIGLHHLNRHNKLGAIGYWIDQKKNGKGIVVKSCKRLITYGFEELGLNRIEIKAAVENLKSQAIPQKLNFKKEGILRQAEYVNEKYLDLTLYSLLKDEYLASK